MAQDLSEGHLNTDFMESKWEDMDPSKCDGFHPVYDREVLR